MKLDQVSYSRQCQVRLSKHAEDKGQHDSDNFATHRLDLGTCQIGRGEPWVFLRTEMNGDNANDRERNKFTVIRIDALDAKKLAIEILRKCLIGQQLNAIGVLQILADAKDS